MSKTNPNFSSLPSSYPPSYPYSQQPYDDVKMEQLKIKVEEVRGVMQKNVSEAVKRGDNLEELGVKAAELNNQAEHFDQGARKIHRHFCMQQWKRIFLLLLLAGLLALLIYLVTKR